jgi:hypothetical protein
MTSELGVRYAGIITMTLNPIARSNAVARGRAGSGSTRADFGTPAA